MSHAIRQGLWAQMLALSVVPAVPVWAGGLPLSALDAQDVAPLPLHLDLVVNQVDAGRQIVVEERGGRLHASTAALAAAGIKVPAPAAEDIALDDVPGLRAHYDRRLLRLMLEVPPAWLAAQTISYRAAAPRAHAQASLGAMLNYDIYASDVDDGAGYVAVWNELRMFGAAGSLTNTGQFRHIVSGGKGQQEGYLRYDTSWRYADEARLLTYEAGDVITAALPWSSSVRLGGVQLLRDFSVRPDLVTYPLPQFAGEVAVPTALDLFVNGYKSSSTQLSPGPYTLTNIPLINGAGQAVVVTTDALGRQVSTTLPFYVSTRLLQPGLVDFSVAAGNLREDYGMRNFGYGKGAGSATLRYGLADWLTLEGHAEAARRLSLTGAGGNLRIGNLGVMNAALSQSHFNGHHAQQFAYGYQYNNPYYSLAYQRVQRQAGYADLGAINASTLRTSRSSQQATASVRLGAWGSAGLGYFDVRNVDDSRSRLLNLSWSRSSRSGMSVYMSANRDMQAGGWSAMAQVMVPMGARTTLSLSAERDNNGGLLERFNYARQVPTAGGFGYNIGYANGGAEDYRQLDATWRGDQLQVQAGTHGGRSSMTRWADVSGSAVWMDGQVFAGNRVDDAFVVVSTGGHAGIPVRYENQEVGRTGSSGHLLVPWTSAYYPGKYEIDLMGAPADIRSTQLEARVMVRARSGYLLEFPVARSRAASVVVIDAQGTVLPLGARVQHVESGAATVVGWDGQVYLENVGEVNHLRVTQADGESCVAMFSADEGDAPVMMPDPVVCR
ncbi:fimbria/pilus outer membrane usher protein [Stenotrophomonas sp.]|uniref:fimbria/pilus outer membrane usher protein n=1 Tax=Stenotrophomonas sp. TaxID=69392 RepID=UPI0028B12FA1|nr:fimbria/pilus outer membrane usher protein [Stenotrophomonas sp.]